MKNRRQYEILHTYFYPQTGADPGFLERSALSLKGGSTAKVLHFLCL